jgi:VWFA-related protein
MKRPDVRFHRLLPALVLAASWPAHLAATEVPFALPLLWPEEQRAFLQDGPGLLLSDNEIDELLSLGPVDRGELIVRYLSDDPIPSTPENELVEGIRNRRELALSEVSTFLDARARLLFLHGRPLSRQVIECAETYKPLEIWTYGDTRLVLYRDEPEKAWELWLPIDSKRTLYNPEMEYWLEQYEELRSQLFGGRRFDRQICDFSRDVDDATGVDGLFGFRPDRPKNQHVKSFLQAPDDLAAWAERAAGSRVEPRPRLTSEPVEIELYYPERKGLRMVTQAVLRLPPGIELEPYSEGDKQEIRFVVEGHLEHDGKFFDRFRMRFQVPVREDLSGEPVTLIVNRNLRPGSDFLMRLKLVEETSNREMVLSRGFAVPRNPRPADAPALPSDAVVAIGEDLGRPAVDMFDSLLLLPPETDVIFGLWRAEVLVTGNRVEKVVFLIDGQQVMTRRRPPFTAELRLETYPTEQVVRVEGYDGAGELVAADEVVLNQPRGQLRVRILDPERGEKLAPGPVEARAEVVVPEEKRVTEVRFLLNDELQATLDKPPWQVTVDLPATEDLTYLTVTAEIDDGTKVEAVRFLNAPDNLEEVDVRLVELLTTVTDRSNRLVRGLEAADFRVWEDGRPQTISKFELVEDLPLTLGITIDTSGSMFESMGEAKRAALDFLDNIITQKDRCFAVAFSDRPALLMPRTSDVGAVAERLESLVASGSTALHDAIVTSLYYYRGIRGRRVLILLSDGEDTSSTLEFEEALEYARRSGVAVYTIGLRIGKFQVNVRRKLENLAQETGGRTFYISEATELFGVYDEIESELRSQYLVAYNSDQPGQDGRYREVKIEVKDGKLNARTMRGYYP